MKKLLSLLLSVLLIAPAFGASVPAINYDTRIGSQDNLRNLVLAQNLAGVSYGVYNGSNTTDILLVKALLNLNGNTSSGGAAAWGSITGTLSSQTDLQTALNLKANLASPALTGVPTAPTATLGTNTTQIATTAFVLANADGAQISGTPSAGNAAEWTNATTIQGVATTGTVAYVKSTTPTLVTPILGVATATSINGNTFTTGTYTLTGTAGKTLNFTNSLTLSGTDSTTMTFPTTSATLARTDAGNTFTGASTGTSWTLTTPVFSGTITGTYTLGGTPTFPATVPLTSAANVWTAVNTFTPIARSSGVANYWTLNIPADTGITAATESVGYQHVTATRTWATTGTVALQRENYLAGPTYASASPSQTFTDAFTLYLDRPIAGTNAIFTRGHTLGIVDSTSAATSITGGFVIATTLGTSATSVGIGGGNVNAGGLITGGTITSTGAFTASSTSTFTGTMTSNNAATFNGTNATTALTITQTARTSGVLPYFDINIPADTGRTASTASPGITIDTATRTWAVGTVASQSEIQISAPTYAGAGATAVFTKAATLSISGAPIQGANATITTGYALWVLTGKTQLDGQLIALGTATNDNAATGYIGETINSIVPFGSAVSLTTGVGANVTSISLTAGDWIVTGAVDLLPANTTSVTVAQSGTSVTTATVPGTSDLSNWGYFGPAIIGNGSNFYTGTIPAKRYSLSGTTTVYLPVITTFTVSTCSAFGSMQAVRIR